MDAAKVNYIIENCPGAYNRMLKWYEEKSQISTIPSIDFSIKDIERSIRALLFNSPGRFLYDFFDEIQIRICVLWEADGIWQYKVTSDVVSVHEKKYGDRILAEEEGMLAAFQILESNPIAHHNERV
ncbi:hypothetical protein SAMN05428988_3243 [Chitinophaga sp. YR573]|uniref:hypothetical protein n=1 Tax=Chitinophaga sp. YR573 TaxID=1881040 RepID=UPI0008CE1D5A|nr:hypothetical protein [Chitinophaga sp. YR573]SEW21729.1 hypothetical protein SAMN05428988_3243 [Chitinophaga sp. YR573]